MKPAMLEIVRKRSISRSSRDTRTPNPASSCARNSTNVRESTRPVSLKSVSTDGTSTCSCSANSRISWSSRSLEPGMSDFLVLGGQQVEQQAIVRPAVDMMTLPLPADVLEVQPLQDALRRDVRLDRPGAHHVQAQLGEAKREHLRSRFPRAAAIALIAQDRPDRSRLEVPIHVGQPYDADRDIPMVRRIGPEQVDVPLGHDLERYRRDHLDSVAEVQPLVIVGLAQPAGHQLDQLRAVQRQQFHRWRTPPATGAGPTCRWRSAAGARKPSSPTGAWERARALPAPSARPPA